MAVDYANFRRDSHVRIVMIVSLLLTWLFGVLSGYVFFEPSFSSLMRSAVLMPVSIVGIFSCIFLPLLFSCFSVLIDQPIIILIVCFIKAVSCGFSCALLCHMFSSAAWIVRFLFLFSDSCFCIVLLALWLHRFSKPHIHGFLDFLTCAFIGIVIAVIDCFVISPFMQGLF